MLVCPLSLEDMIIQWVGGFPNKGSKKAWEATFFATVWSIWLGQNRKVFQDISISILDVLELIKLRALSWVIPKADSHPFHVWCWFNSISLWNHVSKVKAPVFPKRMEWSHLEEGWFKFNVDGSAFGKPGPAGFGGVCCDEKGCFVGVFSGYVGILDSNIAEFLAIHKAFVIFSILSGLVRNS